MWCEEDSIVNIDSVVNREVVEDVIRMVLPVRGGKREEGIE